MNRRTYEGPMDWEYQDQGPVDLSSPFAQISRRPNNMASSFNMSPSKMANPFAVPPSQRPQSPSKSQPAEPEPAPPSTSLFSPQIPKQFGGAFRNPAFTTPQKRVDELVFSECSGAEESPALTDTSEMPADTPDFDHHQHHHRVAADDYSKRTITPSTANRMLFSSKNNGHSSSFTSRTPGRGELLRGGGQYRDRDKIRKRKRQNGDRDVGSVRSRSRPRDSGGDSDSDWEATKGGSSSSSRARGGGAGERSGPGFLSRLFTVIHEHPGIPMIMSWYLQLAINAGIVLGCLWFVWGFISMLRMDLHHATEAARSKLLAEMESCAHEYTKNKCAPKSARLPALAMVCDEWEICMNQDPASVMKVQVSAKNVAEIINEFVGVMSLKAWGFILSTLLIAILANNIGFGRFRQAAYTNQDKGANPYPSQLAGMPMLGGAAHDPNQAYIWAPISQTPRHIRRDLLANNEEATDTDGSPPDPRALMPAPAPGLRRSPSKNERWRKG